MYVSTYHILRRSTKISFRRLVVAVGLLVFAGVTFVNAAGEPQHVRFVTFNVDFNNTNAEIRADVQKVVPKADIMMFQEAKTVTIDNFLDANWTVFQVVDNGDARRGSAIAIKNSIMIQMLDSGLRFGVDRNGEQLLDRYIAWADVKLTNEVILRVMSLHMPPKRFEYLQPRMADNLVRFVGETTYPVVVGGDWNFTVNDDKWNISPRTGLASRGMGIDGFYYQADIVQFESIWRLAGLGVSSDHDPVQLVTNVTNPDLEAGVGDWALY